MMSFPRNKSSTYFMRKPLSTSMNDNIVIIRSWSYEMCILTKKKTTNKQHIFSLILRWKVDTFGVMNVSSCCAQIVARSTVVRLDNGGIQSDKFKLSLIRTRNSVELPVYFIWMANWIFTIFICVCTSHLI